MNSRKVFTLNDDTLRLTRLLDLKPHPEGGFYRRTFISAQTCFYGEESTRRAIATAIYYLLPAFGVSRIHRIDSDEMWHFYDGEPITIVELRCGSSHKETVLGRGEGHVLQYVVPKGTWFGAFASNLGYALMGCTVFPGFDFSHFEIGSREELRSMFPMSAEIIDRLAY